MPIDSPLRGTAEVQLGLPQLVAKPTRLERVWATVWTWQCFPGWLYQHFRVGGFPQLSKGLVPVRFGFRGKASWNG